MGTILIPGGPRGREAGSPFGRRGNRLREVKVLVEGHTADEKQ